VLVLKIMVGPEQLSPRRHHLRRLVTRAVPLATLATVSWLLQISHITTKLSFISLFLS